jgi:membrane-bound acyltransferase YfiQ involved in biofilm formation
MPKALCLLGMVVSILIFLIFSLDLVLPSSMAFFQKSQWGLDIIFVICAAILGYLSWSTLREQDK